jgi:hypothetical protein
MLDYELLFIVTCPPKSGLELFLQITEQKLIIVLVLYIEDFVFCKFLNLY